MMTFRTLTAALGALLTVPALASGQSVVVDEGTFAVTLRGRDAGTETFSIRRAGLGSDATIISNAVVQLQTEAGVLTLRPLLETLLPDGAASKYQLEATGAEPMELSLSLAGRRFVSRIRTGAGEEEREFLARAETRILEDLVAHHYYFLRGVRESSTTPAIEPRTRRQLQLTATSSTDVEVTLGSIRVPARRVAFSTSEDERTVWFDRQGRVLRVEVPARGYVAVRTDLVG